MKLSKSELQDLIITLEKEFYVLERNATIKGIVDDRIISVRSVLDKTRKALGECDEVCN